MEPARRLVELSPPIAAGMVTCPMVTYPGLPGPEITEHWGTAASGDPAHPFLSGAGAGARFTAVPPLVAGMGTFPDRAWASVPA